MELQKRMIMWKRNHSTLWKIHHWYAFIKPSKEFYVFVVQMLQCNADTRNRGEESFGNLGALTGVRYNPIKQRGGEHALNCALL